MLVEELCHDGPNEIVSQDVRPDLLPYEFRRLTTQDVHLHRLLERPQIEFRIPASTINFCQVAGRNRLGIQQRGNNYHASAAESGMLNSHMRFTNREELGK